MSMTPFEAADPDPRAESTVSFDRTDGVAFTAFVIGFGLLGGPLGVGVALVTATLRYVVSVPYLVAIGHLLIAAVGPGSNWISIVAIVILEIGFVVLLLAPLAQTARGLHITGVALGAIGGIGGVTWLVLSRSLVLAAGTALLTVGLVSYAMHRYELLELGLISSDTVSDNEYE